MKNQAPPQMQGQPQSYGRPAQGSFQRGWTPQGMSTSGGGAPAMPQMWGQGGMDMSRMRAMMGQMGGMMPQGGPNRMPAWNPQQMMQGFRQQIPQMREMFGQGMSRLQGQFPQFSPPPQQGGGMQPGMGGQPGGSTPGAGPQDPSTGTGIGGQAPRPGYDPTSGGFLGSVGDWMQQNRDAGYNVVDYGNGATGIGVNNPEQQRADLQRIMSQRMQRGNLSPEGQARLAEMLRQMGG